MLRAPVEPQEENKTNPMSPSGLTYFWAGTKSEYGRFQVVYRKNAAPFFFQSGEWVHVGAVEPEKAEGWYEVDSPIDRAARSPATGTSLDDLD